MKNKELENIIKNDVNFFIEVSKCYSNLTVTKLLRLMDTYPEEFIEVYNLYRNELLNDYTISMLDILKCLYIDEECLSMQDEYESLLNDPSEFTKEEIEEILPPQQVNNLADYSQNNHRQFTENTGRDTNKLNDKLYWIVIIFALFFVIVLVIVASKSTKATNTQPTIKLEQMIDEYHSNNGKAIHLLNSILDTIYYQYVAKDNILINSYISIHDTINSSFTSNELMYISWCEYCRHFEDLDTDECLEFFLDDPEFLHDKFLTYTNYLAANILSENLQFWYKDKNNHITNDY